MNREVSACNVSQSRGAGLPNSSLHVTTNIENISSSSRTFQASGIQAGLPGVALLPVSGHAKFLADLVFERLTKFVVELKAMI